MKFNIIELPEAASTNRVAASGRFMPGSLLYTLKQTAGRGCQGNSWESEPGKNISLTLIVSPEKLPASGQFALSMAAALGCHEYLSRETENVSVKWPNDIYVGDRKIAGILIENTITGMDVTQSLIGIGININQKLFLSDAPNPVSLAQLTGKEYDVRSCIAELSEVLGRWLSRLDNFAFLKDCLMQRLYRRNGIHYWDTGSELFRAEIADIDDFGRLVLHDADGKNRIFGFKEIRYVGAPNSFVK